MPVNLSDVSCRAWIQRDKSETGAKAMSSSETGKARTGPGERTKRSRVTGCTIPGSIGFQSSAGVSVGAIVILRGPVRRSRYGAIDSRQDAAACWRSAGVIVTCTSFSASANVAGVTSGPTPAAFPNVGGAPGGDAGADVDCEPGDGASTLQAADVTRKPRGA